MVPFFFKKGRTVICADKIWRPMIFNQALSLENSATLFSKVLGHFDWAVMAILAKGGKSYARIKHDAPAGITEGKIEYTIPMGMYTDGYEEWDQILADKVSKKAFQATTKTYSGGLYGDWDRYYTTKGKLK